ncbi:LysR family transcriptional regulator [Aeromonas hydrophila]|uniref:LysR family transcriptional regulator n=1 Tax=Aeromonas hydrophila TaxID=644 RepID=A0A926FP31_AERHY|nr:LysR family transcriptional regulator [Aeromonas hydrophila]
MYGWRAGSFTRSAEQLGVPKATLSAAIRRLEEQMVPACCSAPPGGCS